MHACGYVCICFHLLWRCPVKNTGGWHEKGKLEEGSKRWETEAEGRVKGMEGEDEDVVKGTDDERNKNWRGS